MEIRWPSGTVDTLKDLDVNRLYVIEEGGKILKIDTFTADKSKSLSCPPMIGSEMQN